MIKVTIETAIETNIHDKMILPSRLQLKEAYGIYVTIETTIKKVYDRCYHNNYN